MNNRGAEVTTNVRLYWKRIDDIVIVLLLIIIVSGIGDVIFTAVYYKITIEYTLEFANHAKFVYIAAKYLLLSTSLNV